MQLRPAAWFMEPFAAPMMATPDGARRTRPTNTVRSPERGIGETTLLRYDRACAIGLKWYQASHPLLVITP